MIRQPTQYMVKISDYYHLVHATLFKIQGREHGNVVSSSNEKFRGREGRKEKVFAAYAACSSVLGK